MLKEDYEDVTDLRQILDNEKTTLEDIEGIRTSELKIGDSKVTIYYKLFDIDDLGEIGISTHGATNLNGLKITSMLSTVLYDKEENRFFTEDELKVMFHKRLNLASTILYFIVKESGLIEDSGESFPAATGDVQS